MFHRESSSADLSGQGMLGNQLFHSPTEVVLDLDVRLHEGPANHGAGAGDRDAL